MAHVPKSYVFDIPIFKHSGFFQEDLIASIMIICNILSWKKVNLTSVTFVLNLCSRGHENSSLPLIVVIDFLKVYCNCFWINFKKFMIYPDLLYLLWVLLKVRKPIQIITSVLLKSIELCKSVAQNYILLNILYWRKFFFIV